MAYGKGPIKTGKINPGKPGKPRPINPNKPRPKKMGLMEPNEGRMYTGGTPYFDEITGRYRNIEQKNLGDFQNNPIAQNSYEKAKLKYEKAKLKKRIIVGPPAKRKPVQPKVGR